MIVLDANVLIAHLDASDALHDRATALLISHAEQRLGVPALTMAEVLVGPVRAERLSVALDAVRLLDAEILALDSASAVALATLRATTSLKMPDCVVLQAAQQHEAALATFDRRLTTVARNLGIDTITG